MAVFAQGFALVEQLHPPGVVHFELLGGGAAEVADFQVAFGDVEGLEVEGVGGAFVFEDEDVRFEIRWVGSAGVAVGGGEAVAVVPWCAIRSGVCFVIDDVLVVFWLDARGRAAGVGEGGVAPSTPEAAAHKEKEGDDWE